MHTHTHCDFIWKVKKEIQPSSLQIGFHMQSIIYYYFIRELELFGNNDRHWRYVKT